MLRYGWTHARRSFESSRLRFNKRTSDGLQLLQPCRRRRGQSFGGRLRSMMTYETQMSPLLTGAAATRCSCTTLRRCVCAFQQLRPCLLTQLRRQASSRCSTHAVAGGPRASLLRRSRSSHVPSGKPEAFCSLVPQTYTIFRHATARWGHVMYPEAAHKPALELADRLLKGPGSGWAQRVFYSDDGSTAVEIGLKMALRSYCAKKVRCACRCSQSAATSPCKLLCAGPPPSPAATPGSGAERLLSRRHAWCSKCAGAQRV